MMPAGFAKDLRAKTQRMQEEINNKCYSIAKELFTSVVELSPNKLGIGGRVAQYADGHLKNQWYPANGKVFDSSLSSSVSQQGSDSLSRIKGLVGTEFLGKNGTVTLTNNVFYAFRAEYRGWPTSDNPLWTGTVAPYAMIRTSLTNIAGKYK